MPYVLSGRAELHPDPRDLTRVRDDCVFEAELPGLRQLRGAARIDPHLLLCLIDENRLAVYHLECDFMDVYRVRVHGSVDEKALADLAKGVTIEGVRYGAIEAGLDAVKGGNAWLTVGLREGRNREVRRVMAHLGLMVTRLIRIAYGPFQLGSLPSGAIEEIPARVLRDQMPKRG